MPQFSTNEAVSLEKNIDSTIKPIDTKPEDIDDIYEINKCAEWIKSNNFQKVCLQFPDYLLPDSSEVVLKLQFLLDHTVYILGDTAYESCCIDYIAAAHINADAIIHFGPICFSKTSANIPYLHVYEKHVINVGQLEATFYGKFNDNIEHIAVLVDSPYIHRLDDIVTFFKKHLNVRVHRIDEDPLTITNKIIVFIGDNKRKLTNIEFNYMPKKLYYYCDGILKKYEIESAIMKRRNFLIEKIRDSRTVGIIIGTLGVKNYLKIVERLKILIDLSGKKYYLISVGKPTVAKLANFPEIDIYVVVTCSLSEIYESRDFYKPIATPFDVEIALNTNRDKNIKFSFDYNTFLGDNTDSQSLKCDQNRPETDVSLLTNKIRTLMPEDNIAADSGAHGTQIALKSDGTVVLSSSYGAGFLADRSWKGLEQNLGQTEPELAQEGRSGIAQRYKNEQS